MIYNGHDYQELNSSFAVPSTGTYYYYTKIGTLGTPRIQWMVLRYTDNVQEALIDTTGYDQATQTFPYYLFITVDYSRQGILETDQVVYQRTYGGLGPEIEVNFSAFVGIQRYSDEPIWKDIELIGPSISRFQYKVETDGEEIYQGYSYLKPGERNNNFYINDVARDYLYSDFPSTIGSWTPDTNAEKRFEVYAAFDSNSSPTIQIADIGFLYDWSYSDYLDYPYDSWLAMEPIQNYYDSRQYQIFSVNTFATLTNEDDIQYSNLNDTRSNLRIKLPVGSYKLYKNQAESLKIYNFSVKDNCEIRYCLYYVNSRGGWDSVLVDGVATQKDNYDRETYTQKYITPSISRGVIEYRNNITETWTLYLKSLGDNRNKVFHNLYESTNVYLHDLEEDRIVPVIITSREMEYKTRKNQGRKIFTYEITVESSQRKLRM